MPRLLKFAVLCLTFSPWNSFADIWPKDRPQLVVMVVIDQFRADYLSRFGDRFGKNGFKALMANGAYFPFGQYDVLQSMTGPGHATVLTGAYPYQMGIPLNDWYDQKSGQWVYCVEDTDVPTVGAETRNHVGTSPKNLIGTTVGDELKNAGLISKTVSLALKDRAAILMGGHRADLAFWYDVEAKHWVSSQYYRKDKTLPSWIESLNKDPQVSKCVLSETCGIEITEKAFEQALVNENLGAKGHVDILAVSFSSHDYAGHIFGPNSKELEDMTLAEDAAITKMRAAVEKSVPGGLKRVLFVLTGDHGIAPTPDYLKNTGIASGRIDEVELTKKLETSVLATCGKSKTGKWIAFVEDFNFFIDKKSSQDSKCTLSEIETQIKAVLLANPAFAQVFTASEARSGNLPPQQFKRQIEKTFFSSRSGNIVGIQKPFFINAAKNANHMTGYNYDRMVPLLFSGFGIKNGLYAERAEVVDIAPTISFLTGVIPPALSEGRVLSEIIAK